MTSSSRMGIRTVRSVDPLGPLSIAPFYHFSKHRSDLAFVPVLIHHEFRGRAGRLRPPSS